MHRLIALLLTAFVAGIATAAPDVTEPASLPKDLVPDAKKLEGLKDGESVQPSEAGAFHDLLALAHKAPPDRLGRHARKDIPFQALMKEPAQYRGELIHIGGTLARVRRYDPSKASKEAGITDEYEGWIYDPVNDGMNPTCVYFTTLPPRIKIAEKMAVPVEFDGYFFKRYRYKTGAKNGATWRDAPLLLGQLRWILVLEVNVRGEIVASDRDKPISDPKEKMKYIKGIADELGKDNKEAVARVPVRMQADEHADYERVYEILTFCKDAGFKKLQLRATRKNEEQSKP